MKNITSQFYQEPVETTNELFVFLMKDTTLLPNALKALEDFTDATPAVFDASENFMDPAKDIIDMLIEAAKTFNADTLSIYGEIPLSLRSAGFLKHLSERESADIGIFIDEWDGTTWQWTEEWVWKRV